MARYDGKTLTYLTEENGPCGNTVAAITENDEGNLWFGTHTGVCKYDGKVFTGYQNTEGSVRADRDRTIWASGNAVVFRSEDGAFSKFDVPMIRADVKSFGIVL